MKIVIAMDSFKGSASSLEAGTAVKKGIQLGMRHSQAIEILPVADGGEGTVEAFITGTSGSIETAEVTGPFEKKVNARYGLLNNLAILEVAETSGITLVKKADLDPWQATSYGLGELLRKLIKTGHRHFLIGLGGSATNDGGLGMLQALGYRFLKKNGEAIPRSVCEIEHIESVDDSLVPKELADCHFTIASDVTNPLWGKHGATAVYGPQKGVRSADIAKFDALLQHFSAITKEYLKQEFSQIAGAGAAGGLGFAILAYLNGKITPGFQLLAKEKHFEEKIEACDLVITGEGRLDAQSVMGKVPSSLAKITQKYNKPLIVIAGSTSDDAYQCNDHGIDAFFSIIHRIGTEEELLQPAVTTESIQQTAEQLFRFYQTMKAL
ncbi:glycerate kinase family protein [Candidatus Enterococcus murrayae]|uniref:Glycerate kinase n=1 Tax=Candidatus Enterococcus murrayae TaxID=2815321 RepID=A0ABS3HGA2_9ENTE|nr:glycerate kinase [Enterococcus sp. MJM16]MBO0452486.1 glycerate kinase [Enterococcus sp. MJM16]